ncbi:hypothetical protein JQN47_27310, partial [Escherichia coli]|nr:hypothetical protein [Escherichia coli]
MVACLRGMTSLMGIRAGALVKAANPSPLPQLLEGYMNRREAGSIAFSLSNGFVASVGIYFTVTTD